MALFSSPQPCNKDLLKQDKYAILLFHSVGIARIKGRLLLNDRSRLTTVISINRGEERKKMKEIFLKEGDRIAEKYEKGEKKRAKRKQTDRHDSHLSHSE